MKKRKIANIINLIIVILVCTGVICMLFGIHFMSDNIILTASKLEMFKFFTVDSNILMGISSLLYIIYNQKVIKKNKKEVPKSIILLKLVATTSVMLTFIVTAFFLAPTSNYSFWLFYQNSNLFFHLIVPLLSLYSFIALEKNNLIQFKETILGIIPVIIYSIFYTSNVLIHTKNKQVSLQYDFYGFLRNGYNTIIYVIPIILLITYLISVILWKLNRKKEGRESYERRNN